MSDEDLTLEQQYAEYGKGRYNSLGLPGRLVCGSIIAISKIF